MLNMLLTRFGVVEFILLYFLFALGIALIWGYLFTKRGLERKTVICYCILMFIPKVNLIVVAYYFISQLLIDYRTKNDYLS